MATKTTIKSMHELEPGDVFKDPNPWRHGQLWAFEELRTRSRKYPVIAKKVEQFGYDRFELSGKSSYKLPGAGRFEVVGGLNEDRLPARGLQLTRGEVKRLIELLGDDDRKVAAKLTDVLA